MHPATDKPAYTVWAGPGYLDTVSHTSLSVIKARDWLLIIEWFILNWHAREDCFFFFFFKFVCLFVPVLVKKKKEKKVVVGLE